MAVTGDGRQRSAMPWHGPAGGFSALFTRTAAVAAATIALALLQGRANRPQGSGCRVCVPTWCYLVGIRQALGGTMGLELHQHLLLDGYWEDWCAAKRQPAQQHCREPGARHRAPAGPAPASC